MKKSTFAKVLSMVLCIVLMGSVLAGCGGGGSGAQATTNPDQTTFEITGGMSALSSGYDSNPVMQQMASDAGVEINWDLMSDSLAERVGVMISGDMLPDAFIAVNFGAYDMNRYGKDGTFIDLTPYITPEIMPNLSKILDEHPEIRSAITNADGHIYGLPSGELMGTAAIGAETNLSIYAIPEFSMINKRWLDELGLPVPTNLTELHDALVAFKENDMAAKVYGNTQGTIPMSTGKDQWCWGQEIFYAGFGFTNFTSDVCFDLAVNDAGEVSFVSATDAYRDCITYFHDWYNEGLMDLEMFSQSTNQLIAKVSQGRVGVTTWWYIEEIAGDYAKDFVFLPPLKGPVGTKYEDTCNVTIRSAPAVTSGNLNITRACANPELLCKYFDLWYVPENTMQLQYGPIGVYFSEKDENGVWQVISEDDAQAKYGKSSGELKGQYEVYGPRLILPEYYNNVFYMEERARVRLEDLENFWMPYVKSTAYYPNDATFTEDELDTIDRYKTDFSNMVSENEGKWLQNGGPTDAEWNTYLTELKDSCGMDRLLDAYQSAYTRYLEASK